MHIVIRADGGPNIGYGHLVRTGALAKVLLNRGDRVTYATTTSSEVDTACPDGVDTVDLPNRTDPEPFCEWLHHGVDMVLTDSYLIGLDYQRKVRKRVPLTIVVDDTRHPIFADILINGNMYAGDLQYDIRGAPPRQCLGVDYLLLREDIRELAGHPPHWQSTPNTAIVTMGGSDIANITPTVVDAFNDLDLEIEIIVGPGFSAEQKSEISEHAAKVSTTTAIVRNPDNLAERMFEADFAVTTASTTTYELLALGTPIVSTAIVENQQRIASALKERDAAEVVVAANGRDAFAAAIQRYVSNKDLRRARMEKGRDLVDGKGTERIADVIHEHIE